MALQSEVSPPMVGDANKDTKIDGDTKSDDNSSQSSDEGGDLEEGEILDSGEEAEEEKKDFTNSSLKEALDKSCLLSIEQLVSQAKNEHSSVPKKISPRKMNQIAAKYTDHDQVDNSDAEDGWFPSSPKYKSKFEEKPIDYRMELAAYRGTPPSSPERKRRDDKPRKKRSSKKSKKTGKKTIKRKDIKGLRVMKYKKESQRLKSCKFFKEGKCAKGAECGYSHASPQSYKKKELCKFYLNGHCNKGKECLYMHSEFPCKFYHTGSECYAKDDCRFSHAPLTEEMKRILDAYLKVHHGDDDYESRKRRVSRSPEPKGPAPKRVCLLGSPPRHIREAEETKRWQEEMKMLQQQNHPGFEIHLSPCKDNASPPQYPKPNFYQETLPNTPSPPKRRTTEAPNPLIMPPDFPKTSPGGPFPANNSLDMFNRESPRDFVYEEGFIEMDISRVKEEPDEFRWKNMHGINHGMPVVKDDPLKHFVEPDQQEQDFTSDVKFDETTQFSEMESSTDGPLVLPSSPAAHSTSVNNKEVEEDASNQGNSKINDGKLTDEAAVQESAPQIVIPSHLPRKQRELFMRIQQHQRKNAAISVAADVSNSPKTSESIEPHIKKEETDEDEENVDESNKGSKWYSSEDDDDDDIDQPLTDVLKKLSKAPPAPKTQEAHPKPSMNLIDMLNKIQQNTLERNKAVLDSQQQQGTFWKNLLLGAVPPSDGTTVSTSNPVTSEPKRRTLLPDPPPIVKKEPVAPPKDPRLKNRDPRTAASTAASLPKLPAVEKSNTPLSAPSAFPKITAATTAAATITNELITENVPYRLHGIYTKPPNYTPYIFASQSNPKLLNDPRVRKHMNLSSPTENNHESGKESDIVKASTKDVPPVPKLLLKYEKPGSLNINIFETNSSKPDEERKQDTKSIASVIAQKLSDPRMRKRDSRSSSGSDTPPLLSIVEPCNTHPSPQFKAAPVLENALIEPAEEKKWLPPVLEKSWTPPILEKNWAVSIKKEVDSDSENNSEPPQLEINRKSIESKPVFHPDETVVKTEPIILNDNIPSAPIVPPLIIKKVKPTPASHLPRAIADPRMAKLHHPLDSRRSLVTSSDSNKSIIEKKKAHLDSSKATESTEKQVKATVVSEQEGNTTPTQDKPKEEQKTVKSIPKKRRLSDKSEEKKKTVHRNRKSSMDYASPLNSCDTNSEQSLGYNSYNQRPKMRTAVLNNETEPSVPSATAPLLDSTETTLSDYLLSDSSNLECDNSNDVNLKDMFKTIDPTASPFC